jgi:hypothetical protein
MQDTVEVRVNVARLKIGNRDWQEEEVTYHKMQTFSLPRDDAVKLGNSVTILEPEQEQEQEPVEPESDSGEEVPESESAEDQPLLPDLTEMNSKDAIEFIQNQNDRDILIRLKEMEEAGKNRTSILNSIEKQLSG